MIDLLDAHTGSVERRISSTGSLGSMGVVSPDGKKIAVETEMSDSGRYPIIAVLNIADGRLLATMAAFPDGEWITFIPEGYYTGSAHAENYLSWRVGDKTATGDMYSHIYRRPDLVRKSLAGMRIEPRNTDSSGAHIKLRLRLDQVLLFLIRVYQTVK
jgi:hypothetical protein